MSLARAGRRLLRGGRARWALALLALAALAALRLRREAATRAAFPRHSPAALAHFLADFANQPRLHAHIGAWRVQREWRDAACWHYAVQYECGARCAGRATVAACDGDARTHGASRRHRVRLALRRCWRLPALGWPLLCDHLETDSLITPLEGGGAQLEEQASARCGVLATVAGRCDVRALRLTHHTALRELLG
ncbi:uncharacterized protein LOC128198480 [Bicyclus anynana]|uniref:Uncharacterized protein LOC128198480 n=1 Tax=Bicyclus anynana TaxID=110368 RepID=A0ABM3LM11_BICAN|nr:uncharacterized protein LOC128198480 [Bicyclus anynana]